MIVESWFQNNRYVNEGMIAFVVTMWIFSNDDEQQQRRRLWWWWWCWGKCTLYDRCSCYHQSSMRNCAHASAHQTPTHHQQQHQQIYLALSSAHEMLSSKHLSLPFQMKLKLKCRSFFLFLSISLAHSIFRSLQQHTLNSVRMCANDLLNMQPRQSCTPQFHFAFLNVCATYKINSK